MMAVKIEKKEYESLSFYDGEIELKYDVEKHIYLLPTGDALVPVDGVTTVCKIIDKSNILINWAVKITIEKLLSSVRFPITEEELIEKALEAKKAHRERLEDAGAVGTQAHTWIETYIKQNIKDVQSGELSVGSWPDEERVVNCCRAAVMWMTAHNVRWGCTERKVYSRYYNFAGTLDGIARVDSCDDRKCCPNEFKDRLSLIDWKTSNYIYNEYLYQTAAYQYAYTEETREKVEDRWIIRLGKDDGKFEKWHLESGADEDFNIFLSCLSLTRGIKSVTNRMNEYKNKMKVNIKTKKKGNDEKDV